MHQSISIWNRTRVSARINEKLMYLCIQIAMQYKNTVIEPLLLHNFEAISLIHLK